MMRLKKIALLPLFASLAGCWTFNETEYPSVAVTTATKPCAVALTGFEAYLTEYEAVQGYRTIYIPGHYGRHYYSPGYYESVPAITYLPQSRPTDLFLRRAQDSLESAGFTLGAAVADRTIDLCFEGPFGTDGALLRELGWMFGTAFFCDYDSSRWTAKLRIRDAKSGKLLFRHEYEQVYETNVFGLIPLFGPASCTSTSLGVMKVWCLSALTDRAMADATAFLAGEK